MANLNDEQLKILLNSLSKEDRIKFLAANQVSSPQSEESFNQIPLEEINEVEGTDVRSRFSLPRRTEPVAAIIKDAVITAEIVDAENRKGLFHKIVIAERPTNTFRTLHARRRLDRSRFLLQKQTWMIIREGGEN